MERITLFKMKSPGIDVSMEIYFNDEEQLIFSGYNIGEKVKETWGDLDYEYFYTIEPKEVKKLYPLFGITGFDKQSLLLAIKKRFEGDMAYSKFGKFMQDSNIDFTEFAI